MKYLNDENLHQSFANVVKSERKILHLVISYIQEIAKRRSFLKMGYASLFDYLVKAHGYSASSAQRRIEAARLVAELPELSEKIESGEINLTLIGEIQRAAKVAEKIHLEKVGPEIKAEIIDEILTQAKAQSRSEASGKTNAEANGKNNTDTGTENNTETSSKAEPDELEKVAVVQALSKREAQKICAKALNIPVLESESINTQQNGSFRIETTFSQRQQSKFELVKGLVAQKNFEYKRTQSFSDVFETCMDVIIESIFGVDMLGLEAEANLKTKANRPVKNLACGQFFYQIS
jgi:hypothetical protein